MNKIVFHNLKIFSIAEDFGDCIYEKFQLTAERLNINVLSKEQIVLSIGNQIFLLDSTAKWDELNFIDCYERMANQLG